MNKGKLVFAQVMERLVLSICAIVKKNAVPSQRTLAHARLARVTTHRTEIHVQAPSPRSAPTRPLPTLADLCTQACQSHGSRRFLRHKEWMHYDHTGRPHMALGPGIPLPPPQLPASLQAYRHRIPTHLQGVARLILGGLHHEYQLEEKTA
jgi:hypothetical protein